MDDQNTVSKSDLDLETQIPLTAIVDVKHGKITSNRKEKYREKKGLGTKKNKSSDIKYVCRVCLKPERSMISLMTKIGCNVLADMFSAISTIEVHENDNFPMQMCVLCHNSVLNCYKFRLECIKSDNILKSLISKSSCGNLPNDTIVSNTSDVRKIAKNKFIECMKEINICENDIPNILTNGESEIKIECELDNDENGDIEYLEDEIFYIDNCNSEETSISKHRQVEQPEKQSNVSDSNEVSKRAPYSGKEIKSGFCCRHCSMRFAKPKLLSNHMKQSHADEINIFRCNKCSETFNCREDLQIHSALHIKGNQWTCNKCFKVFNVRNKFRRHIRRHMESTRHTCACGKTFPELHALRRHARVHTGERAEKKYACDVCGKRFCDSSQLSTHMSRHTGARPCACADCGKAFPSRRLLASHRLVHSDDKQYACEYCDKRFRHESTRNTHHRTHTGEKPYVCSACGKTFIQNSNLRLHMRTHTGERPYTCDTCGRKFSSGSSLKCHIRIHTGEKPYSCHICGKRFARTDLRTHLRVHTGERPHACCVCAKRFGNAARLREHSLVHTGEKPFECTICSEQFKRKSYLSKHMLTHNKETKLKKKDTIIVQQTSLGMDDLIVVENAENEISINATDPNVYKNSEDIIISEVPLEVSQELVLQDDSTNNHDGTISLNTDNFSENQNTDMNNIICIEENRNSTKCGNAMLYQLDQNIVQITSNGPITIHKVIE